MNIKFVGGLLLALRQQSMAQSISVNTLSCGTAELRLGMSEKAVTEVSQAHGCSESSSRPPESVRSFYNSTVEHTCNVEFDKHALVYVERYWSPSSNDGGAAIETFIDAVQSVTRKAKVSIARCSPARRLIQTSIISTWAQSATDTTSALRCIMILEERRATSTSTKR